MPDPKLYLLFTAITALGVLLQAGILLGIALGARETKKKLEEALDEVRKVGLPVLEQSRVVLADAAPKIKIITEDLVETTKMLKKQATRVDGAVDDVLTRTRHQVARVDAMVGNTLDVVQSASNAVQHTVTRASETFQHAVEVPTRRISGVVNGVMAAVDQLRRAAPNGSRTAESRTAGPRSAGSRSEGATRYRRSPVTSADVAAAGRPMTAVPPAKTDPIVPPGN